MIVKPQTFSRPSKLDDVGNHVAKAVDFGVRGVGFLRGVLIGAAALPLLFAGLAAGVFGNVMALFGSGGVGLLLLWLAKRQITSALKGAPTQS